MAEAPSLSDKIMGRTPAALLARYEELRQYSIQWARFHPDDLSSCADALKNQRIPPHPYRYAVLLDEMAELLRETNAAKPPEASSLRK